MSKSGKRNLKFGMGIVEKGIKPYIMSHPDFLEDLNHGDHVVCIEYNDFGNLLNRIIELQDTIQKLSLNPKMLKKIRIQQLKEELKELEDS
ncbi:MULTISPECIES: hypothetical protein [Methanobacterium]|uniref:Uncharacterized protein n=1 Tax=Methanobacterium veterum TaxID=408577 RepID=A0A9E5A7I2_9EURY|nr:MULTISPECIES: hypothetical protein [Methanobacterium]MCZ3367071.1 hypothetical protein [Methanobacterium veterum]MCZ3373782.1 hypothetical protein [Methanobacterium veterum]